MLKSSWLFYVLQGKHVPGKMLDDIKIINLKIFQLIYSEKSGLSGA